LRPKRFNQISMYERETVLKKEITNKREKNMYAIFVIGKCIL
jgi:hypothetical protein